MPAFRLSTESPPPVATPIADPLRARSPVPPPRGATTSTPSTAAGAALPPATKSGGTASKLRAHLPSTDATVGTLAVMLRGVTAEEESATRHEGLSRPVEVAIILGSILGLGLVATGLAIALGAKLRIAPWPRAPTRTEDIALDDAVAPPIDAGAPATMAGALPAQSTEPTEDAERASAPPSRRRSEEFSDGAGSRADSQSPSERRLDRGRRRTRSADARADAQADAQAGGRTRGSATPAG